MLGAIRADSFNLINQAIAKKCTTICKGDYRKFDRYELFVFSSILADNTMLKNELDYLIDEKIFTWFSAIYILVPGALYYFDLRSFIYNVYYIDSNKQFEQATRARRMVEKGDDNVERL